MVDTRPEPPVPQDHHRDVKGGAARAAVFGVSGGFSGSWISSVGGEKV